MGMILSCQLGYKRASRGPLSAPEGAHCIIWMTVLVYSLFRAWVSSTAMSSIDGGRHQSSWLGFATLLKPKFCLASLGKRGSLSFSRG